LSAAGGDEVFFTGRMEGWEVVLLLNPGDLLDGLEALR
jgi:hypothetical protein